MPYQVRFTEVTNPSKPAITVEDQSLDKSTSITFVGKNYAGYGSVIAENFLHLLENFARNTPPGSLPGEGQPVQGQLWYDNSPGKNLLKVWDGTTWQEAGSVKKNTTQPSVAIKGDIWVDTQNSQVYVYSGSNWLLIGPQYTTGKRTGPVVESLIAADEANTEYYVTSIYSNDTRIAVISSNEFIPKVTLPGFETISRGITLTNAKTISNGITQSPRFAGTATGADALVINEELISATNFLRGDAKAGSTLTNIPFNIRANSGLTLGADLSFNIGTEITSTIFYSKTSGNSIDFKLNAGSSTNIVLHIGANGKIGIGNNNTAPNNDSTLDVKGNVYTDSAYKVATTNGTTTTVVSSYGSSLSVSDNSIFSKDLEIVGQLKLSNNKFATSPAAIVPTQNKTFDIGTSEYSFRNIYAENIVGNVQGTFTGDLTGNISGSAARLSSPTSFYIGNPPNLAANARRSEIESNTIQFDGENDSPAVFLARVTSDVITQQIRLTASGLEDLLLVYRAPIGDTLGGLRQITKRDFIADIPSVPVGAVFPYAGASPPPGYLFCDGAELNQNSYKALYDIIGLTYTPVPARGQDTFALPDLRGRFPLPPSDMVNTNLPAIAQAGTKTISQPNGVPIPAVNPVAPTGRVTGDPAKKANLGKGTGSETKTLTVDNIPEHNHTLTTRNGQYWAAGVPNPELVDNAADLGRSFSTLGTGYGLPRTGGVDNRVVGQSFDVMNPYMTINYIIYTGVI